MRSLARILAAAASVVFGPAYAATGHVGRDWSTATAIAPSRVSEFTTAQMAAALLAETNRVRWEHGRRALRRRAELGAAADDQAAFMALIRNVQHTSPIRRQQSPGERVRNHGLEPERVAENVAACPITPESELKTPEAIAAALVAQWMASPPHRMNLLSREFTHIGAAVHFAPVLGNVWGAYGVQVFASGRQLTGF